MFRARAPLMVLLLAAAVGLAGAARGDTAAKPKPRLGGSIVYLADGEPPHLNPFIPGGDHLFAHVPHVIAMAGAFRVTPSWTYERDLVSKATVRKRGGGMVVRYVIDKRARWSDGVPITAEDFRFTWRVNADPRYHNPSSSASYEPIASVSGGRSKTVTVSFRRILAGWRDLFAEVLPAHALAGADMRQVWRHGIDDPRTGKPIASGPFYLADWRKGCCLIFQRNRRYSGKRPYLDRIVLRFADDLHSGVLEDRFVNEIARGHADMLESYREYLASTKAPSPKVRFDVQPSDVAETLEFNLRASDGAHNPLVNRAFVRRAIAYAVGRKAIAHSVGRVPVLESVIVRPASRRYRRHWSRYRDSAAKARALMRGHGCRLGGDGIFVCEGRRASFRWVSTSGGQRRELIFAVAREHLSRAGIEVVPDFAPPPNVYERRLPDGDYDVAEYGLRSGGFGNGGADLAGWDAKYGCGGTTNWQHYCDRKVTAFLRAANRQPDAKKQAALVNEALARMAAAAVVVPLYVPPKVLVRNRRVHGVSDRVNIGNDAFWDVARWWRSRR